MKASARSKTMHASILALLCASVAGCSQTLKFTDVGEFEHHAQLVNNTLSRGMYYCGSDAEFHHFACIRARPLLFDACEKFALSKDHRLTVGEMPLTDEKKKWIAVSGLGLRNTAVFSGEMRTVVIPWGAISSVDAVEFRSSTRHIKLDREVYAPDAASAAPLLQFYPKREVAILDDARAKFKELRSICLEEKEPSSDADADRPIEVHFYDVFGPPTVEYISYEKYKSIIEKWHVLDRVQVKRASDDKPTVGLNPKVDNLHEPPVCAMLVARGVNWDYCGIYKSQIMGDAKVSSSGFCTKGRVMDDSDWKRLPELVHQDLDEFLAAPMNSRNWLEETRLVIWTIP